MASVVPPMHADIQGSVATPPTTVPVNAPPPTPHVPTNAPPFNNYDAHATNGNHTSDHENLDRVTRQQSNSSTIRIIHLVVLFLIFAFSVIVMSLAASLLHTYYRGRFPPVGSYKARIRFLLFSSVFSLVVTLFLGIGVAAALSSAAFGIISHLVLYFLTFVLILSGAAALTDLTSGINCGHVTWSSCNIVKGLAANAWILTILLFAMFWWTFFVGLKRNRGHGLAGGIAGGD